MRTQNLAKSVEMQTVNVHIVCVFSEIGEVHTEVQSGVVLKIKLKTEKLVV